jgi:hypothetical protein
MEECNVDMETSVFKRVKALRRGALLHWRRPGAFVPGQ